MADANEAAGSDAAGVDAVGGEETPSPAAPLSWTLAAVVLFALGVVVAYGPLFRGDLRDTVLATRIFDAAEQERGRNAAWLHTTRADTMFAAWLVGRHAHTLVTRPLHLLDTEHCAPARRTIALAEPMLTLGLLAVPARLMSGDPILAYNAAVLSVPLLGALAMFLLVADWTRVPAAGMAAGLLYAFHPILLRDVTHPFIYDLSWTLFALFFARRLLAWGRWRDAAGLSAACALQLGASFYPFLAAVFLTPPLAVWLLRVYGLRAVRPAQLALVAVALGATAWLVFAPYLELRSATELLRRPAQSFASWVSYLPSGPRFPGWIALALVVPGLLLGRRRVFGASGADPRVALVVGGLLVALAAAGGNHNARLVARLAGEAPPLPLPDPYAMLAALLPGLDSVRGVLNLSTGVHAVVALFAGLGAAALLRLAPARHRLPVGIVLVAGVAVATLRPAWLGFAPRLEFDPVRIRPPEEALAFYERLAALGNEGPLFEVPVTRRAGEVAVEPLLLSAWHGRRTSACFGSYEPPELDEVAAAARDLPAPESFERIRALGFTTLVLHDRGHSPLREGLERAARGDDAQLRRLADNGRLAAWALTP